MRLTSTRSRPGAFAMIGSALLAIVASCGTRSGLRLPDSGRVFGSPVDSGPQGPQSFAFEFPDEPALEQVDLLLAVDNSNSMRTNQANLLAQIGSFVSQLTDPPCVSASNNRPHPCNSADPSDRRARLPVRDLQVGVVSSDLGTPGSSVPGCPNSDSGDDGLLNPIRNGQSLARHLPWISAPPGFRPNDCNRVDQFPSFIAFQSGSSNQAAFEHDLRCNAALYVNGCGLEQQLESVYRALVWHNASATPGNTDPNAGFLRPGALLAILLFSDEDDFSVRDCRYARAGEPCNDALDVYNASSTRWSNPNLNLRAYMYGPGREQDPTWPLDRYVDPRDPSRGFPGLKPGHPERVVFATITGVPLVVPLRGALIDWNALLGRPDPTNPDNFSLRDSQTAIDQMSREGPVSMRQANADRNCPERTVPACRREGSPYDPARPPCLVDDQYFAWPARRIVEIARRFDESPLCLGRPCRNSIVSSICANSYSAITDFIPDRIQSRLPQARCLPNPVRVNVDPGTSLRSVDCTVRELLPAAAQCDPNALRTPVRDAMGNAMMVGNRAWCATEQVGVDSDGRPVGMPAHAVGWFYDVQSSGCAQRVAYAPGSEPAPGTLVRIECTAP